jgi:hypothetical protein
MATIEEVLDEWKKDAVVNQLKVGDEITRVPLLHSKYLGYFIEFRAKRSSALKKLNSIKNVKRRYYRGEFTKADLENHGWEQWQGLKPSSAELNQLFEQDEDLNDLEQRLEYWNTSLNSIEYIMKAINSRGYELRTLFEYMKFQDGS